MGDTFNYTFHIKTNAQEVLAMIQKMNVETMNVSKSSIAVGHSFHQSMERIKRSVSMIQLSAVSQMIGQVSDGFSSLASPGLAFGQNMQELSAIAGVSGKSLEQIGEFARENAKVFGGSASESVESYKLILSQLGPDIAQVPEALKAMGEQVSVTSKLMGGNTVAATEVLTTAMNQYGISTENPQAASAAMANMMNVMAAAAKAGSAELPAIQQALSQSGMAAANAGVSFEELNSAIQVLDKAGKKGAEGGVAIRNMLSVMAEGRFMSKDVQQALRSAGVDIAALGDKSKSLHDRLDPLKKIMNDSALMTKMFGRENLNAAYAMIGGADEMAKLTPAITGTNEAYKQAEIVMEGPIEKNKRLKASVDDFKISLFNSTGGWLGYASVLGDVARDFGNLLPVIGGAAKAINFLSSAQKMGALWTNIMTGAQAALNVVMNMNPAVLIISGIAALVAIVVVAYNKFSWFRGAVQGVWEGLKMFGSVMKDYVLGTIEKLIAGVSGIGRAFLALFKGKFSEAFEIGKEAVKNIASAGLNLTPVGVVKHVIDNSGKIGQAVAGGYRDGSTPTKEQTQQNTTIAAGGRYPNLSLASDGGTTQSIVTGGAKQTTLIINIDKVVENITNNITEGKKQAQENVDALLEGITRQIHGTARAVFG